MRPPNGTPRLRQAAANSWVNAGNTFGANSTLGNEDAYTLGLLTNNATRLLIDAAGNVGIGSLTPTSTLDVNGTLHVTTICDQNGANCKSISGGWGAGGSVTDVGTGVGLVAGSFSTYGTLNVDVGTTANKIMN